MKTFLHESFMLNTKTAEQLYHNHAKLMPIADYHCHINPKDVAEDRRYGNMAEIWITCGDHYKWRAIRTSGYAEKYVTGDASDYEKFSAWAGSLPNCIGNPLYIWAHMELKTYFGYGGILNPKNCETVWELCNEKLKAPDMSARAIMKKSNVKLICTTDDPADSLEYHKQIKEDSTFGIKVLPAFRPDKGVHIEKDGFKEYIILLGKSAGISINSTNDLLDAYIKRIDFFDSLGCKTADQGFEAVPFKRETGEITLSGVFAKAMKGEPLSQDEIDVYKTEMLLFFAREYHKRGWVLQIHFGVSRNNRTRLFKLHGPDAGADAIGNFNCVMPLSNIMNTLDYENKLPKTVLYSINPSDNTAIDALIGCFQDGSAAGKIQHGSAWWFNDNNTGMRTQMSELANNSLLATFIGMLTDSRSFLSYTRHDYFRRILCDLIGTFVENGEYPNDMPFLGKMVENICYNNTDKYFGFCLNS